MTAPLTPADLDELGRLYHEAKEPWDSGRQRLDSQSELAYALLDSAPPLIAAARERDALKVELEVHKGASNKLRSDLAAEVRRLRAELIDANALLEACARQFVASDYDGKLHHSCMATDQALCRHLVKTGSLVPDGDDHFRWAVRKPTTPTQQEKEVTDLRLAFGLRAQGHLPTVERMLAEGLAWDEIGIAIGWCPKTAAEYYGRERKEPIPTMPTGQEKI